MIHLLSLCLLWASPWDSLQSQYAQAERGLQQISDWRQATATAIEQRKPLCVFIGCPSRPIPRAVSVRYDDWPGVPAGVVVYQPNGNELRWQATLPPTATDDQIAAAMNYPAKPGAGGVAPVDTPGSGDKPALTGKVGDAGPVSPIGAGPPFPASPASTGANDWSLPVLGGVGGAGLLAAAAAGATVILRRRRVTKPDGTVIETQEEIVAGTFMRGARPTPRHKLLSSPQHRHTGSTPPQVIIVPSFLEMWLNDSVGDCVTAEEAFAKAAYTVMNGLPETKITDATVKAFCNAYGFLNGANLTDVMDKMISSGFQQDAGYKDGAYASVDYSNEGVLQNAIALGPVKIGIDANALPGGAGNANGWSAFGGAPGQFSNEDHCVALCGYGPTAALFAALGVPVPSGAPASGYLLYTWSTIGVVDHAWIMSTCGEAWLRNPTTPGVTPAPTPTPIPPAPPTPTPTPTPIPGTFTPPYYFVAAGAPGGIGGPFPDQASAIAAAQMFANKTQMTANVVDSTDAIVTTITPIAPAPPSSITLTVTAPASLAFSAYPPSGSYDVVPAGTAALFRQIADLFSKVPKGR